jgi:NADPH-dependent 2,4-dienoyl-CoA reductase/sulfur reductase-like enzyme
VSQRWRVIIVGGGFGGLRAAQALKSELAVAGLLTSWKNMQGKSREGNSSDLLLGSFLFAGKPLTCLRGSYHS